MTTHRLPLLEILERPAVLGLADEWGDLLAASSVRSPFMTWPWIGAWLDTLGAEADLEVHVARDVDDGRILGVAPFHVARTRRGGVMVRELRMLGSGTTAPDHLDLVVRDDAEHIAAALWESVDRAARWDLVDLDGIEESGYLTALVLRRTSDEPESVPAPYLPLSEDWEEVRARFGRSHRQNIGRYARKLDAEAGAPVVERMVADPADLDRTMDALIRMHQSVRRSKGDLGLFADEAVTAFLRTAAHRLLVAGRLRMWRLDIGDEAAAVIWCIRAFDSVAFYTTGFDGQWGRYGPGRRIMARAIEAAAAEGALEFDFLRGDEEYKSSWGTEVRHVLRLRRPASARGRLVWAARAIATRLRRGRRGGS